MIQYFIFKYFILGGGIMRSVKEEWKQVWLPEIKSAIKEFKNPKTRYRQIPNLLTASRLVSPLVIIPVSLCTNVLTTFIIASLFALTDAFDGKIARKYHLKSKLGAMLDPVTDKLFALGLLIPNIVTFPIMTISIISLEGIIGIINSKSTLKGNKPRSNLLGKTKTTFVSISAIAMYLTNITLIKLILPFLIGITLCLQTSAAITYKIIDLKKDKQKTLAKKESFLKHEVKVEHKKKEVMKEYSKNDLKRKLLLEKESLLSLSSQENIQMKKKK